MEVIDTILGYTLVILAILTLAYKLYDNIMQEVEKFRLKKNIDRLSEVFCNLEARQEELNTPLEDIKAPKKTKKTGKEIKNKTK